ncbi:TPA: hypothetical protein N0F65_005832 [Lagenidium giganteum]|uniref:CAP-Gly domain-containing protein n=1 Tax=Lagenidium giganteum TaxID=4803 RepID=A0AAV2YLD2_9STRA|nr:TPA: hypothetical protein N0F65_008460 [Lagenidium giganteum]DAZ93904.1 TPA: hypothetical protein N0F65_005832 [Lagenidium giganteum]
MAVSKEMERIARNPENWQERLAALIEMQRVFENVDQYTTNSVISADVWRALKPLKLTVQDLRSQIVKEACNLLTTISKATRDAMVGYMREIMPTLLDVRGSGNRVCGSYCCECIEAVVCHTVVKGPNLRFFVDTLLESKNKLIRLACITSLKLVLVNWSSMLDKTDVQQLERGLRNALYDASSSCRSQSHEFFLIFQQKFPKRASLLVSMLDYKVQKRLESLTLDANSVGSRMTASDLPVPPPAPLLATFTATSDQPRDSIATDNASVTGDDTTAAVNTDGPPAGINLDVGDRVCIPDKELFGFVRFLGEIEGVRGVWVGIELDEPYGKNDGSVKGRYYFHCKPKHGVFARPHQVFLTISGSKLVQQQQQQPNSRGNDTYVGQDSPNDEALMGLASKDDAASTNLSPFSEAPSPDVGSSEAADPSPLRMVLIKASIAHRKYLEKLLQHVRSELEEHQRFENYATTASSADAVQYLQQLQNCAQDKIVLSDMFIQQIIQAQQAARES